MAGRATMRLGGICGVLYVLLLIPAYLVGSPDAPSSDSSAQGVFTYFHVGPETFVFLNGVLAIFAVFFFVWFLGILHSLLRSADEGGGLSSLVLSGGTMFAALVGAGLAVEILYPATLTRFDNFQPQAQHVFWSLTLSTWLYHFAQVGTAVLVSAASLLALGTGVLPRWLALAGFVVALLALLHFLIPLLGALVGMLWVAVVSVLMLAGSVGSPAPGPRHLRRSP